MKNEQTFREIFNAAKPPEREKLLAKVEKLRPNDWESNPNWIEQAWQKIQKGKK